MFVYCNNNPVVYKDPNGQSIVAALIVGGALLFGYIYVSTTSNNNNQENNNTSNIKQSKTKPNFVPNPNKRKGSDKRQPTGERQRNVGHPNGEEHSRVPKGNRGIRRIEALAGVVLTSVAITVIAIDDFTLVGVSNDVALAPTTVIWWDYASVLMN